MTEIFTIVAVVLALWVLASIALAALWGAIARSNK
jgi:hypothetical protein